MKVVLVVENDSNIFHKKSVYIDTQRNGIDYSLTCSFEGLHDLLYYIPVIVHDYHVYLVFWRLYKP